MILSILVAPCEKSSLHPSFTNEPWSLSPHTPRFQLYLNHSFCSAFDSALTPSPHTNTLVIYSKNRLQCRFQTHHWWACPSLVQSAEAVPDLASALPWNPLEGPSQKHKYGRQLFLFQCVTGESCVHRRTTKKSGYRCVSSTCFNGNQKMPPHSHKSTQKKRKNTTKKYGSGWRVTNIKKRQSKPNHLTHCRNKRISINKKMTYTGWITVTCGDASSTRHSHL